MSLYRYAIDAAPRPCRLRDGGGAAHDRSPPRRSTTLASSGFRIKFAALFFGGRLGGERPPRCAITQWFQDLAPPIIASTGEGVAPAYSPPYDGADDASKLQRVAVGVT